MGCSVQRVATVLIGKKNFFFLYWWAGGSNVESVKCQKKCQHDVKSCQIIKCQINDKNMRYNKLLFGKYMRRDAVRNLAISRTPSHHGDVRSRMCCCAAAVVCTLIGRCYRDDGSDAAANLYPAFTTAAEPCRPVFRVVRALHQPNSSRSSPRGSFSFLGTKRETGGGSSRRGSDQHDGCTRTPMHWCRLLPKAGFRHHQGSIVAWSPDTTFLSTSRQGGLIFVW